MRLILPSLALAAALAARPSAAQPVIAHELSPARPDGALPTALVLADSAGTLVARLVSVGDPSRRATRPDGSRTDTTPAAGAPLGALDVVPLGRNGGVPAPRLGRWAPGVRQGESRESAPHEGGRG
jgi:hypothetical protein